MSSESLLFWVAVLLLGYTYLGYPALMHAWAALCPRPPRSRSFEPTISILIVAHNEAPTIHGRIENLLALDYPQDRVEILLASDGSTDGTPERAREYRQAGVRVIAFERRRGKPAVLNDLVPKARGEIVVLADARQRFEVGALRALVRPFGDPQVGVVSGELILTDDDRQGMVVAGGIGFYWRYEKFIRWNESRVDSTVGATGAIYAIRQELFLPIPEETILDDVMIPMRIASRGYRVHFAPEAKAYDRAPATAREEFTRKVRTIAGNFQLFARERWLLNPFANRLWLQTVSHKGLRLMTPLLLVVAFGTNLVLLEQAVYRWMLAGQIVLYGAALAGYARRNSRKKSPLLSVPYVLCLLAWATVVAFVGFVSGRQSVKWKRASAG
jgi:cellulose synthase/poly-beta-1,6-N-acetylglucosamine synthase-like glycosyltransferase